MRQTRQQATGNRQQGGPPLLSGDLRATFDRDGRARVHTAGPLELRGPLAASKLYYLRNVTAGVFEGDCYRTAVHCAPDARARVESSSATKVYSMPSGCATTKVELDVEPGGRLVWGPHATILHTGSSLRQEMAVTLHEGATVLMAETLVMGRVAAGQRFDFSSYASKFSVRDGRARVRYTEAYELQPGNDLEAAMGGLPVLTTVYALGAIETSTVARLDELCAPRPLTGCSTLPGGCGLVLKALAASLSEGTAVAREALAILDA